MAGLIGVLPVARSSRSKPNSSSSARGSPTEVINTFDFTVSMLGTNGKSLYFGPHTWTDLFRKRLRVHHVHHGISTMRRMVKYSRRGFQACVGTMRKTPKGWSRRPAISRSASSSGPGFAVAKQIKRACRKHALFPPRSGRR
jgi:hypothetical protein